MRVVTPNNSCAGFHQLTRQELLPLTRLGAEFLPPVDRNDEQVAACCGYAHFSDAIGEIERRTDVIER